MSERRTGNNTQCYPFFRLEWHFFVPSPRERLKANEKMCFFCVWTFLSVHFFRTYLHLGTVSTFPFRRIHFQFVVVVIKVQCLFFLLQKSLLYNATFKQLLKMLLSLTLSPCCLNSTEVIFPCQNIYWNFLPPLDVFRTISNPARFSCKHGFTL